MREPASIAAGTFALREELDRVTVWRSDVVFPLDIDVIEEAVFKGHARKVPTADRGAKVQRVLQRLPRGGRDAVEAGAGGRRDALAVHEDLCAQRSDAR